MNLSMIISNSIDFLILAYLCKRLLDLNLKEHSARAIFESITFTTAIIYCVSVFLNAFVLNAQIQINLMLFLYFWPISLVFSLSMTNTNKSRARVMFELMLVSFGLQYLVSFPGTYYAVLFFLAYASKSISPPLPQKTQSVHK